MSWPVDSRSMTAESDVTGFLAVANMFAVFTGCVVIVFPSTVTVSAAKM